MRRKTGTRLLWAGVALAALGCADAMPASAQVAAADEAQVEFQIGAQPLAQAAIEFSRQAGVQLVLDAGVAEGVTGNAVSGRMTAAEGVTRLLSGTGLIWRRLNDRTITIERPVGGASGERVLGAVRVQGAQGGGLSGATVVNGVNGSRDVTATEGTGSYTSNALTVGSKTVASIKDTPMSVSVITNQQLQDQNITDLNSAMRDAPGITVLHDSASQLSFYSRGFKITQMQIDGGAAQIFAASGAGPATYYHPIIDLSLYDHVEIVRGATGTFNAYGDPGGVLNLVRKRPLDHSQMLLEMQLGSWDWHRVSVDITGPLAFGGKLRGRLIATHQDNDYFYEIAKANRNVVSGTLELDLTPTTLVTAGVNYQEQKDTVWNGGLPRYQTGAVIDFPKGRATCLCFPWANNASRNLEFFGQIEQRIGSDWNLKVKATRIRQNSDAANAIVYNSADPVLGTGPRIQLNADNHGRNTQTQIEATLDGSFRFLGQVQKVLLGANYSMLDPSGSFDSYADFNNAPLYFVSGADDNSLVGDIRRFDNYAYDPSPYFGKIPYRGYEYGDFRNLNAYLSVDLSPLKGFHFITSLRYSQYRNRALDYFICTPADAAYVDPSNKCQGQEKIGKKVYSQSGELYKGSAFSWPPSVQVRYDASNNLSAYAIYTDIYIDRSNILTRDNRPLPPTTGENIEGGLKWQAPSRKLNITLSGYYTQQINTSIVQDGPFSGPTSIPGQLTHQQYCCFKNEDGAYNLSYGADFEVSGEIVKRLQLSASYTYNINKRYSPAGATYFDGSRQALQSTAPRHLAKLWATYAFDERTGLNGLRLGFGAQARTKTFITDSYCPVDPISTPNGPECPRPPGQKRVFFTDPGYVVLSGSIGYRFSDRLSIDAELENLLDKTYFEQVGGIGGGNWYGSPRSIKVSLRGKF